MGEMIIINVAKHMARLALNIRRQREHLNYSQEYVAGRLNISQSGYSKIEQGASSINVERLYQIAEVLEITPKELLEDGKRENAA